MGFVERNLLPLLEVERRLLSHYGAVHGLAAGGMWLTNSHDATNGIYGAVWEYWKMDTDSRKFPYCHSITNSNTAGNLLEAIMGLAWIHQHHCGDMDALSVSRACEDNVTRFVREWGLAMCAWVPVLEDAIPIPHHIMAGWCQAGWYQFPQACDVCQELGPPYHSCRFCVDKPSKHHARCCSEHPWKLKNRGVGGAATHAGPRQGPTDWTQRPTARQTDPIDWMQEPSPSSSGQRPAQQDPGGAGINAAPPPGNPVPATLGGKRPATPSRLPIPLEVRASMDACGNFGHPESQQAASVSTEVQHELVAGQPLGTQHELGVQRFQPLAEPQQLAPAHANANAAPLPGINAEPQQAVGHHFQPADPLDTLLRMPEPTPEARLELGDLLELTKMPAFHWRQILSAHNTSRPGGKSINASLETNFGWGRDGHRLVLALQNSYEADDGLSIMTYMDDRAANNSALKYGVCKQIIVELLLRAPRRYAVRLSPATALQRIKGGGPEQIWDKVRLLQTVMHGNSPVALAVGEGAVINAL